MATKIIHQVNNSTGELRTLEVVRMTASQYRVVRRNEVGLVTEEFAVPRKDEYHTYHDDIKTAAAKSVEILDAAASNHSRQADAAKLKASAMRSKYLQDAPSGNTEA